ncbi:tetratricopeptide repeat protein [Kamptonema sp. UHCC 0994]|uniref:tetratricopeptide repeat protein n=1 Tax=Kamptonema sp. UHCC 0994 TaxID=3031329 RepID=UPI0023BA57F4|nr:tetratricopeptide repeat protein [Kamptonema sp. UHCC 0994]MDF0556215.1 tetratricopeptide repeat protein [Kamptonema sp. UHCC 0994]
MKIRNLVAIARVIGLSNIFTAVCGIAIASILLSPSATASPPATSGRLLAQQQDLQESQVKDEIRDRVSQEVDSAFRRTASMLNIFLIVLTFFPTAAAVGVWILLGKLAQQTAIAQQEIASLRDDTISQLKTVLTEAQTVLDELNQQGKWVEEDTDILFTDPEIQEFTPVKYGDRKQLMSGSDYAKQGDAYFFENRYDEAVNAYNQALQIQPELADTWNNRGVVLTRMQRYSEAIDSYEQATKIRPNYPDAWNNKGVVLLEMQQLPEAIVCYEQAIQAKSDYADAWNNRGVALSKMQKYEEAVISYNQALVIRNDYTDAWNNRGVALTKLQKYDAAIDSYDNATKLRPDFYRIWYNKARCYALQGQIELALENLKRAFDLNPNMCKQLAINEIDFESIMQNAIFKQLMGNG